MADRRPVWALPPWIEESLREELPDGWSIVTSDEATDGSGDGAAALTPALERELSGAEVYLGYGLPAELVRRAPDLRWAHSGAAGVRGSITPELRASSIVFTNSAGIHAPPVAETVLAMMLHFFRGLDFAVRNHQRRRWSKLPFLRAETPVRELGSATVGIVGHGGIGRSVARLSRSFGARVLAVRRRQGGGTAWTDGGEGGIGATEINRYRATTGKALIDGNEDRLPKSTDAGSRTARGSLTKAGSFDAGDMDHGAVDGGDVLDDGAAVDHGAAVDGGEAVDGGVADVRGPEALPALLRASDAAVIALPDTPATRGLIDDRAFSQMKPGALLVNVSRGRVVDETALVRALRSGRLRGAALDVFQNEPLSADHPLWDFDNVLLTPHVSAVSREYWRREFDLIRHNLKCHLEGAPLERWRNVVDLQHGY